MLYYNIHFGAEILSRNETNAFQCAAAVIYKYIQYHIIADSEYNNNMTLMKYLALWRGEKKYIVRQRGFSSRRPFLLLGDL